MRIMNSVRIIEAKGGFIVQGTTGGETGTTHVATTLTAAFKVAKGILEPPAEKQSEPAAE